MYFLAREVELVTSSGGSLFPFFPFQISHIVCCVRSFLTFKHMCCISLRTSVLFCRKKKFSYSNLSNELFSELKYKRRSAQQMCPSAEYQSSYYYIFPRWSSFESFFTDQPRSQMQMQKNVYNLDAPLE